MVRLIALIFFGLLAWSCSQQSTKPAAIAFHNINAKYNAIWQADRLLKDLNKKSWDEKIENFTKPLGILPAIDSSFGQTHQAEITNLIRKASLVIDRHQNSRYIDDAYLIIGHGRWIKGDLKNAIETYKYVNSIDHDALTQANSFIQLYKIYIYQHDFEAAIKVEEAMKEIPLSPAQKTHFLLCKSFYLQEKGENLLAIALLEEIITSIKSKTERARLYYVLGQLFEKQGKYTLALERYNSCVQIKSNYDLLLHAQIAIKNVEGNEIGLANMLKEPKNEDRKSEIYVALGQLNYAKKDFKKAQEYWKKATVDNPNKGELYLQLAQLFLDPLKKYTSAAQYFDSAATFLPPLHPSLILTQKLKKNWTEYVRLEKRIQTDDSLLILGQKPREELMVLYQQANALKQKKIDSLQQKATLKNTSTIITYTRRPSSPEQQGFYFYNDMARIQGAQEFGLRWGNRNLEDFWNRKNKDNNLTNLAPIIQATNQNTAQNAQINTKNPTDSLENWLAHIPTTEKQIGETNKNIEKNLFQMGKFAKLELGENELAKGTLERLLTSFPNSAMESETFYLLYLSAGSLAEKIAYKNKLADRFPDSYFRQLILKSENGSLSQSKELEAQKAYELAYEKFKLNLYESSYTSCLGIQQRFPNSKLEDKIVFLMALCKGGLKDLNAYQVNLKNFIQLFPSSPLKIEAESLLQAFNQNKR